MVKTACEKLLKVPYPFEDALPYEEVANIINNFVQEKTLKLTRFHNKNPQPESATRIHPKISPSPIILLKYFRIIFLFDVINSYSVFVFLEWRFH